MPDTRKQLRVAIWHNLPSGGGMRALYDQVRGLISGGHHVEVWCPPTADRTFLPLGELVPEHIVPLAAEPVRPAHALARLRWLSWATGRRMRQMEDHCRLCAAEISAGGFDVVLVHPCRLFRASALVRFLSLPTVLYLAEPFRELYEAWPELPWAAPAIPVRRRSPGYWWELFLEYAALHGKRVQVRGELEWVREYSHILVNSLFSRESLLRAYNVDSRVCYLGVDTTNFQSNTAAKEPFVIGLGNLGFNKRPLLAIQAVGAIPPAHRPKLVWVGNSADPRYLQLAQAEAARLAVDFTVNLLIPDTQLQDLLRRAAAMIYTSHLEPFGYAPLEANACGTGVVAVAEGGVRETVAHPASGILIPNADPIALGAALQRFSGDLAYASRFGREARHYVETTWSPEKAAAALESELRRAIAAGRAPSAG